VETGIGFAILPSVAIAGKEQDSLFTSWRIGTPPLSRTVHLARSNKRSLGQAVAAVERLCRATLANMVQDGSWASSRLIADP
jgi:LysR family nitrogen assimilation transcriptional regulator